MDNVGDYMSTPQAARCLGVCETTVRSLERRGLLPGFRDHAGRRLFKAGDVEKLKAERSQVKPGGEREGGI